MEDEVVISVSGKPRYVVIDLTRYDDLCECEIAAAWAQMREDVAAGRYTLFLRKTEGGPLSLAESSPLSFA